MTQEDIFTARMSRKRFDMPEINIPKLGEQRLEHFMSVSGHVVVRVASGGESYMIYVLDDTDQEYRVKSVNGPYRCN